jgi:dienelactone hydrolase
LRSISFSTGENYAQFARNLRDCQGYLRKLSDRNADLLLKLTLWFVETIEYARSPLAILACETFLDNGKQLWLTAKRSIRFSMTRRQALLLSVPAYAQLRLPSFVYRDYPACLPDYVRNLASTAREKRLREIAKLTTPAAVQGRQRWVRETLTGLIGGLPSRTPVNERRHGSFEREGYVVEKLTYESLPNYHVSANLYVPAGGGGPFPGVLFQLGHSANGKAYDSYQCACQGLVKLGFVVLAFDPMGQGERVYYPDESGIESRLHDVDEEHTMPGRQMLLVGSTCTQFQLWDAIRSLDYLAGHPLVDPKSLASVGQSGGATLTMLLAAMDDRLAVVAEFSGNTENLTCKNFLPPGSTDDAEQDLIGSAPLGLDRWDLLYPFAPKPLLVSISDKDSFGTYSPNYVSDSAEEYQRLANSYRVLGAAHKLAWVDSPLPHGLSYDSRLQLYNWLRLHLKHESDPVHEEPPVAVEPDRNLWVTESGSLIKSLGGETPFTLTKKRFASLSRVGSAASIDRLLRLEQPLRVQPSILSKVPSLHRISVEALDVAVVRNVGIPAWLFRSEQSAKDAPAMLLLDPKGRNSTWREGELCQQLAVEGIAVCAGDVRGSGDLAPQFSSGAPSYARAHQISEDYAWSSLILGRPLAGQRVTDILALVHALQQLGARRVIVAARGEMTVPALFAAALEPSIEALYLAGGLSSFASIVETEKYYHPFASFVPGILKHTDLPELAARLAPRRVKIAGAVDGGGQSLSMDAARHVYKSSLDSGHLSINESLDWDVRSLARFAALQKS